MQSIPVFFRPEQVAPAQGGSPSAAKPTHVVESWLREKMPIDVRSFTPASRAALSLAHDPTFVDAVLDCREDNGFGTRDPAVAASLPYTSGSFLAAAREALANKQVACSPTSGFHHATWDSAMGFCTFNGLMVAACTLIFEGAVWRIGILDLDAHYGNGTADIIEHFNLQSRIFHYTRGCGTYRHDGSRGVPAGRDELAERTVINLPRLIEAWKALGIELLMYQAGADSHIDDPLGGGFFTTGQMRRRDAAVFETCKRVGLPVVWNLAGGYQEDTSLPMPASIQPVLDIHNDTMRECIETFIR